MAEIRVSLIQNADVLYTARQGNRLTTEIVWEQETALSTPEVPAYELIDISDFTFFAQLRTASADDGGAIVHTFAIAPGTGGNYYEIDLDASTVTYVLSTVLMRSLKDKYTYYLESKMLNGGENIESVVITVKIKEEYSRAV